MKYLILLNLLFSLNLYAQQTSDSFLVTIDDDKIRVVSPKTKMKVVGIIIKNNTFDDIRSEIATDQKTLKRFNLKAQGSASLQVNYSKLKTLYYVSIAPPFQAVELKFTQRPYEIPEKK
jgi:hypothetical protein